MKKQISFFRYDEIFSFKLFDLSKILLISPSVSTPIIFEFLFFTIQNFKKLGSNFSKCKRVCLILHNCLSQHV